MNPAFEVTPQQSRALWALRVALQESKFTPTKELLCKLELEFLKALREECLVLMWDETARLEGSGA